MNNDFKELYELFMNVKRKGWIRSKRKGPTGVGYTFEESINKPEENFPIPDFKSIEIKATRKSSMGRVHLFSATPDGDFLFPIDRIIEKLGYPDKKYPNYKVFCMNFNGKFFSKIGIFKKGKINVNYNDRKVDFIAFKNSGRNLNVDTSWSFDMLEEKLNLKLKYLAIIRARTKKVNGIEYFLYDEIKFYKLKDFNTFLKLIEDGCIGVSFNISIFKDELHLGKRHDRGCGFFINNYYLNKLYDEVSMDYCLGHEVA